MESGFEHIEGGGCVGVFLVGDGLYEDGWTGGTCIPAAHLLCPDCTTPHLLVDLTGNTYNVPPYTVVYRRHDDTCPVMQRRKKGVEKKVRKRA